MKVIADPSKCVTAGLCVVTAETIFDQAEETGTVTLLNADPPPEVQDSVRQAVRLCPSGAIAISEDNQVTQ